MGKLEFLTPYGEKTKVALITAEFFMEVCSTLKMAPTNAMKLRQLLLKHPNIRVESYLKDKLQERRHELDQFFSVQEMSFYVYPDEHDIDDLLENRLQNDIIELTHSKEGIQRVPKEFQVK